MRQTPHSTAPGGTRDRPKRYLIESRFMTPRGAGVDAEVYSVGLYGRVPYPDTAERILQKHQQDGDADKRYHYVQIVDKGSRVVVSRAGSLETA